MNNQKLFSLAVAVLLCVGTQTAAAENSWMGVEYGTLNMTTDVPYTGGSGLNSTTPVYRFSGEVCAALFGTEGEILQVYGSDSSAPKPNAASVLGLECEIPFWESELEIVDVAFNGGFRYRYHSHFKFVEPTYGSLPVSATVSKKLPGGLMPYATVGFGPIGFLMKDKYGQYSALEAGIKWQFADQWKASLTYNKVHDEAKNKVTSIISGYDSTMTTLGIHLNW